MSYQIDLYQLDQLEGQRILLCEPDAAPIPATIINGWAAGRPYLLLWLEGGPHRGAEIWVEVTDHDRVMYRVHDISDGFLFNFSGAPDEQDVGLDPVEGGAVLPALINWRWRVAPR